MSFNKKLKSYGWFICINALIVLLLSSRFFTYLPEFPSDPLAISFIILTSVSHSAMLVALLGLIVSPLLLLPNKLKRILVSAIAATGVVLLFADTLVFSQYRFHINAVVVELLLSGQIVEFPLSTWLITIASILGVWFAEWALFVWLDKKIVATRVKVGPYVFASIFVMFLASACISIWSAAHAYQPVTMVTKYLPLYQPITANSFMRKQGWINEEELAKQKALTLNRKGNINYPLQPLDTVDVSDPVNILMIVIDSWRFDTFSEDNTPNLWKHAQNGISFQQHLASGSATRTGIFSLFYGLPGTYWHGVLNNGLSPVLIDRLQELNYQLGIFSSAQLRKPEFSKTVFLNIPDLRMESEGSTPAERDSDLTKDWQEWYSNRDASKPAFSFLFYDAPHGYDFPIDYPRQYEPMVKEIDYIAINNETDPTPIFNRYKTSVHYVDSLIQTVFDTLESTGELDKTLVIITGDHAQEMNDNKLNYWGHNSNFTNAQIHVPFIMIAPKVNSDFLNEHASFTTSHQDIAPTVLQQYLGVVGEVNTYSTGVNLFKQRPPREWVIAANYNDYAIVSEDSILEVNEIGQYSLLDKTNRPLKDKEKNTAHLQGALEHMSRFTK